MAKNCDNCINSGRPSYEYPCTVCVSAYDSAPTKWESIVPDTADMVEVVRCKDCKNCEDGYFGYCTKLHTAMDYDAFCAYGERKDNG